MNKTTGIIVVVLAVILGGVSLSMGNNGGSASVKKQMEQKAMEEQQRAQEKIMMDKKAMEEKEAMEKDAVASSEVEMKKDEVGMVDKVETMVKAGSYEAYSADKIARAETGDVVLFFHASWCPSCRGLSANIESNLKSIPEGVTILKTDYDKETELKKKYGVTYQHTLVQVDKSGNMIKKWSGSSNLSNLISQIQ